VQKRAKTCNYGLSKTKGFSPVKTPLALKNFLRRCDFEEEKNYLRNRLRIVNIVQYMETSSLRTLKIMPESGSGSTRSTCFWASPILLSSSKIERKNFDSFCFVTSFGLFIFEK
jgi:hypothetical protein